MENSVLRRARGLGHRARLVAHDLWPARRTVHAVPRARVPPPPHAFARLGDASWIVPPCRVTNAHRIELGAGVGVLEHSILTVLDAEAAAAAGSPGRLILGDGVRLARFNTIVCGRRIEIGDGVASSDGVSILDTWRHPPHSATALDRLPLPADAPVTIGRHAYLGCNSTIYPGVTIGEGAYIGEGAVVVSDVPAYAVVHGNPATIRRRYDASSGAWSGTR